MAKKSNFDGKVDHHQEMGRCCCVEKRREDEEMQSAEAEGNENWEADGGIARKIGARGPWNTSTKKRREGNIINKPKGE
jgi:hypothetical protein